MDFLLEQVNPEPAYSLLKVPAFPTPTWSQGSDETFIHHLLHQP